MNISIKELEQSFGQQIQNHAQEISEVIFQVKNNMLEFKHVKDASKDSMEQFIQLQKDINKSKKETMELFESEGKRNYENFEKLNHHQSKLETLLDARLSILDISVVRITALENIANEIKDELKEINDFLIDLQNIKVDVKTFEEKTVEQYTDTRRLRIQVDDVTTQMKTLENFCEKYIPLQTQNAISKTMHGFIGPTQKARLEDYEIEIFTELHNVVLDDDGQPDLSDEKEKIINEINEKLAKLQEVYKERHLVSGPSDGKQIAFIFISSKR